MCLVLCKKKKKKDVENIQKKVAGITKTLNTMPSES